MWLVIGYGSTLHSDDGFGPIVAEQVRALTSAGSGRSADLNNAPVEVITSIQLTPEMAEPVSCASGAIFIDASTDRALGQVQFFQVPRAHLLTPSTRSATTHQLTPALLLDTAVALYGHAPPAWLCTTGGAIFDLGETISPIVAQTVPRAVDLIMEHLRGPRPTL